MLENIRHKTGNFRDTFVSKNYHCTARITQNSRYLYIYAYLQVRTHTRSHLINCSWTTFYHSHRTFFSPLTSPSFPFHFYPNYPPSPVLSSFPFSFQPFFSFIHLSWLGHQTTFIILEDIVMASNLPVPLQLHTPVICEAGPECDCRVWLPGIV